MTLHKLNTKYVHLCPVRDILDRITDRWSILVISFLKDSPKRFGEIKKELDDISQVMLSKTLRKLEENSLVVRSVHATSPPSVEYSLSELGRSFLLPLKELIEWADANMLYIQNSRPNIPKDK